MVAYRGLKEGVDALGACGAASDVRAVEREGVLEVLARRERGPECVIARHVGTVLAVGGEAQVLAVERDVAGGDAGARLEGEHVEKDRLASARGACAGRVQGYRQCTF